ncbi:MAG: hypothetical protein DMF56_25065 [Acidobacteria bacterium]|nr:MAG: hypothetical protein DMF56_25065 [Acidobacteriota bacterium]
MADGGWRMAVSRRAWLRDVALCVLLSALCFLLYRKVVRLWWTYDDVYLVHIAIDHTLGDEFFNASVWPQKLFTPLVMAVYESDMALFGLEPARWFVVHLAVFALSAIAFYAALRLWLSPARSGVAALLYAASVPVVSLITEISGIHYFLGILFGSLATIAYVAALRRPRRPPLHWVSAALYFVAILAKETVIPLPFLFLALPERNLRSRARYAAPHVLSLLLYFVWRRAVIGTILGGYGWAIDRSEWLPLIASLPKKIVLACAGANVAIGVTLIVVMLIGIFFIGKRGALLFVVALALSVGPILPVSKEMQRRYALMPWLCWSVAFVAGVGRASDSVPRPSPSPLPSPGCASEATTFPPPRARKRARARARERGLVLLVAVPLLMLAANRQEWGYEFGRTQRMSDEARFFFDMPPDTFLRRPIVPPAAMGELNWLKTMRYRKPYGAMWFYDDYFLCSGAMPKRAWEFDPSRRAIVEITSALPSIAKKYCGSIRQNAPLSASFEYRDAALFWKFGPYTDGKYRVLIANGVQAFDVPRVDGFRMPDLTGITLRIRYDSPQGWTTYSPELALDFKRQPRLNWTR